MQLNVACGVLLGPVRGCLSLSVNRFSILDVFQISFCFTRRKEKKKERQTDTKHKESKKQRKQDSKKENKKKIIKKINTDKEQRNRNKERQREIKRTKQEGRLQNRHRHGTQREITKLTMTRHPQSYSWYYKTDTQHAAVRSNECICIQNPYNQNPQSFLSQI